MAKFTIVGTHRETRATVRTEIEAGDAVEARRIANERGVIVDECIAANDDAFVHPLDDGTWRREQEEYRRFLTTVPYRAMRRAAIVGTLWALLVWTVIWLVIQIVFGRVR